LTKPHVIVYSRVGCHLCDEAKAVLRSAGVGFDEVDIESDEELLRKYKHDIPVVTFNGVEMFRHRVDEKKLRALVQVEF
jgi:glutaredoxin